MLAGFWIYDPKKQAHTHAHTHTLTMIDHILFLVLSSCQIAEQMHYINAIALWNIYNDLKFIEIYLHFLIDWGGGRLCRAWLGKGEGKLGTHLPIRDLSIYVSNEANRKHFLCLASNLWPVTGPTLSTHSQFLLLPAHSMCTQCLSGPLPPPP